MDIRKYEFLHFPVFNTIRESVSLRYSLKSKGKKFVKYVTCDEGNHAKHGRIDFPRSARLFSWNNGKLLQFKRSCHACWQIVVRGFAAVHPDAKDCIGRSMCAVHRRAQRFINDVWAKITVKFLINTNWLLYFLSRLILKSKDNRDSEFSC